jgi:hypothetical protein
MIAFRRGVLLDTMGTDVVVEIDGARVVAEAPVSLGATSVGASLVLVQTTVEVGIERRELTMAIGPWPPEAPDPAGPLGLASTPVIVLPDPVWSDLATAGALRAGRRPACVRFQGDTPALGLRVLVAVTEGADVVLVEGGAGPHLRVVRTLGGRPLAVLPLPDRDAVEMTLQGCGLDVHLPVPSLEEPERSLVADCLRPLTLEETHHIVEVDPAPAFEQAGLDLDRASLHARSAAAAGVLAGRLAASNRRWRAELET